MPDVKTQLLFFAASNTDVDTTAEQITTEDRPAVQGVLVQADHDNTGDIWVGNDNAVAVNAGFRLAAGEAVLIEVRNANSVWVIASVDNQQVNFLVV